MDLDQQIRDVLDQRRIGDASGQLEDKAIRAVLDLHQPYLYSALTGVICGADDHPDTASLPYPCPTVRVIAEQLGIAGAS